MKGACDQIDHQEHQYQSEPPWMIHIEEIKKVQHLKEANPVSLNIIWTGGILRDQCANDRKNGEQNEKKDCELKWPK